MPAHQVQRRLPSETLSCGRAQTLVDISEMSRRLGNVAVGTLYNWVYQRRIPFLKVGRCLRFDPDEVIRSLPHSTTMDLVGNG